jgi:hypothetical protein
MKGRESPVTNRRSKTSRQDTPNGPSPEFALDLRQATGDSLATGDRRLTRPVYICAHLLHALDASDGRRRRRKRDTTPDSIGLSIKRELLEGAVRDDPDPDVFECWLVQRCEASAGGSGAARAMAIAVLEEWHLAQISGAFRNWLETGAPSDDTEEKRS